MAKRNPVGQAVMLVVALGALAGAGYVAYQKFGPDSAGRLSAAAASAVDALRARLTGQAAFDEVRLSSAPGEGGAPPTIGVEGVVPTAADARALAAMLVDASPRVAVRWSVQVDEFRATPRPITIAPPVSAAPIDAEIARQKSDRGSANPSRPRPSRP